MASLTTSYLIILFCLLYILCTDSVEKDYSFDEWPRFYKMGESTHPTQSILNNLTYYRARWNLLQHTTYAYTMAWDCIPCAPCLRANKFINVVDDSITSLATSKYNDKASIAACSAANNNYTVDDYKTIDELYDLVIDWVTTGVQSPNSERKKYLIIELMLHQEYMFPMAVKLSMDTTYIGWDIDCFEPGEVEDEDDVCEFTATNKKKKWTFWITRQMQSFLGWSMIFLILVACSLGYCINCLKKKKAEKIEAWRAKEEKQVNQRREEQMEREREQSSSSGKKKGKKRRKGSKSKHRSKKGKKHRHSDKEDVEYANVPVIMSQVDDEESDPSDHYDIIEEQHP
eukprot:66463_1